MLWVCRHACASVCMCAHACAILCMSVSLHLHVWRRVSAAGCVCALCADASGQCPAPSVPSLPPPATLAHDSGSLEGHCARGAPPVSQRLPEVRAARRAGRWGKGGLPVQGGSPAPPDQPQRGGAARARSVRGRCRLGRRQPRTSWAPCAALAPQVGAAVLGRGYKVQGPRLGAEVRDTRAVSGQRLARRRGRGSESSGPGA